MNASVVKTDMYVFPVSNGVPSKEEFYPYLAYIRADGKPADLLFSHIALDLSAENRLSAWEAVLSDAFNVMRSLDLAFGDVKLLLGLPADKCCSVFIIPPKPKISLSPFGDINSDGITEKILDAEDKVSAFSLFVSSFCRRLALCSFENLKFCGWMLSQGTEESYVLSGYSALLNQPSCLICENSQLAGSLGYDMYLPPENILSLPSVMPKTVSSHFAIKEDKAEFLLTCALSEDYELRGIYDGLYNAVKGMPAEDKAQPPEITCDKPKAPFVQPPCAKAENENSPAEFSHTCHRTRKNSRSPRQSAKNCNSAAKSACEVKKHSALFGLGTAAATLALAFILKRISKDS